jgi:hypothetical protein
LQLHLLCDKVVDNEAFLPIGMHHNDFYRHYTQRNHAMSPRN